MSNEADFNTNSIAHLGILLGHHEAVCASLLVSGVLHGAVKELRAAHAEIALLKERLAVCREVKDGYYAAMAEWRSLAQEGIATLTQQGTAA